MKMTYIIPIGLVIMIILTIINRIQKHLLLIRIQKEWGKNIFTGRRDSFYGLSSIFHFYETRKKRQISDQTWKDLNLDDVFDRINRTYSSLGAEYLFRCLNGVVQHDFTASSSLEKFILSHPKERTKILYQYHLLGKDNGNSIVSLLSNPPIEGKWKKWLILFFVLFPYLSLFLLFYSPILAISLFILSFAWNIFLSLWSRAQLQIKLENFSYLMRMLSTAVQISKINTPIQDKIKCYLKPFYSLRRFSLVFYKVKTFSDMDMFLEYFNTIFLLPLLAYYFTADKVGVHLSELEELYHHLSMLEGTLALTEYKLTLPYYCVGNSHTEKSIKAEEVYHPLTPDMVKNPVDLSLNTIMSGDNASGKSTYLRVVALNLIISQIFGFAFAKSFSYYPGKVMTSFSVEDSLQDGESYFVAESQTIKEMVDEINSQAYTYLFIDELFKGTNTIDRLSSGVSLIEWLMKQNCFFMISTHDKEIIDRDGLNIAYLHFSSCYENGKISYDYQLKRGKSQTSNAIHILEAKAFPKEIIEKAEVLQKEFVNKVISI